MGVFWWVLAVSFSLHAEEPMNTLARLEGEPSALIAGCVDALTGTYCETATDLYIPGVEPLTLQRTFRGHYVNESLIDQWSTNYRMRLRQVPRGDADIAYYYFTSEIGSEILFASKNNTDFHVDPRCLEKGVTNCAGTEISAKTHWKNARLHVQKDKKTVTTGAGTRYLFQKNKMSIRKPNGFTTTIQSNLENEIEQIALIAPSGKKIAALTIYKTEKPSEEVSLCKVVASDGRHVSYKNTWQGDCEILEIESPHFPKVIYTRTDRGFLHVQLPQGHFRTIEPYKTKLYSVPPFKFEIRSTEDPRCGRVKQLLAPVGVDSTPVSTHRFVYHLEENKTSVLDAYNHLTQYSFNADKRLERIQHFIGTENHALFCQERIWWGQDQEKAQLICRALQDAKGNSLFCRVFRYDKRGNILKDKIFGNLTGKNRSSLQIQNDGKPFKNGCECYVRNFTYSQEGLNLLLCEESEKQRITYAYKKGTDLLIKKLLWSEGKIQNRTFYNYDDQGAVCLEVCDDGAGEEYYDFHGMTERRIKRFTNKSTPPVGLAESIEDLALDLATGEEILLKKIVNAYDPYGNRIRQEVYDSTAHLQAVSLWEYNERGQVVRETNALGHVIVREYDENGNCIFEEGPNPSLEIHRQYDFANRLISTKSNDKKGFSIETATTYDFQGHPVSQTDRYGHTIFYTYDDLGRVKQIKHPPVLSPEGDMHSPIEIFEYDLMGNCSLHIDSLGGITRKEFNIRGQPILITYPDETVEFNSYNLSGELVEHVDKLGTRTCYTYDYLSRVTQKNVYNALGKLLNTSKSVYNAFHLLSETDPNGLITFYTYDAAGRVISVTQEESRTEYTYDCMGRMQAIHTYSNGDEFWSLLKKWDLLDRLTEESTVSQQGHVLNRVKTVYDEAGNCVQTRSPCGDGLAVTTSTFNAFNELTLRIDPLGHKTLNRYDECTHGVVEIDPQGTAKKTIFNSQGLPAKIEKHDSLGKMLQKQQIFYDLKGNKIQQRDSLITPQGELREITSSWEYDSASRLIAQIEALGTFEQKVTRTVYNTQGLKAQIIKPDGIGLIHFYDSLGRLIEFFSTDNTLHYRYKYDAANQVVKVEDFIQRQITFRNYDKNRRLVKECLGKGVEMNYSYDWLGRIHTITYPDTTQTHYIYDACRLAKIERKGFVHHYKVYDQSSRLISAKLMGKAGTLDIKSDLMGRTLNLVSLGWCQKNTLYDSMGNLLRKLIEDLEGKVQCYYRYDSLNQLSAEEGMQANCYVHDSLFNRILNNGTFQTYNSLLQLQKDEDFTYLYDKCGRLSQKKSCKQTWTYIYDPLDRLICVKCGGSQTNYTYDFDHRRVSKNENGIMTHYLYQGQNEIGTWDPEIGIGELRILGLGKGAEIGASVAIELQGELYVPLHDPNGNIVCLYDLEGHVVDSYRFSAFGEELSPGKGLSPWRFSSKRVDPETGFVYFGRRHYDPHTGRWISPDPLGLQAGSNVYAYVQNRPLTHIDLYGLLDKETGTHTLASRVCEFAGNILRAVGDHCLPIPKVRDLISALGHRLQGGSRTDFRISCRNPPSFIAQTHKPETNTRHSVAFICGMLNRPADCLETAESISKQYGGINVHYCYNSSQGFAMDLMETFAQLIGVRTQIVDKAARFLKERVQSTSGSVTLHLHSQGGLIGYRAMQQLTAEERSKMDVITFGSAKIIESKTVGSAMNYISGRDAVPWVADPLGCMHAIFAKPPHVEFLSSKGMLFSDHLLASPNYHRKIVENGQRFLKIGG